ncbi:hypothetical protein ACWCO0_29435 [Streptomyces tubercidicus]
MHRGIQQLPASGELGQPPGHASRQSQLEGAAERGVLILPEFLLLQVRPIGAQQRSALPRGGIDDSR